MISTLKKYLFTYFMFVYLIVTNLRIKLFNTFYFIFIVVNDKSNMLLRYLRSDHWAKMVNALNLLYTFKI